MKVVCPSCQHEIVVDLRPAIHADVWLQHECPSCYFTLWTELHTWLTLTDDQYVDRPDGRRCVPDELFDLARLRQVRGRGKHVIARAPEFAEPVRYGGGPGAL